MRKSYFMDNRIVRYRPGEKGVLFKKGDGSAARVLQAEQPKEVGKAIKNLKRNGFDVKAKTYQMGLHLAGKNGNVVEWGRVLSLMHTDHIKQLSTGCYNALMELCIAAFCYNQVFDVRNLMAKYDRIPDTVTYLLMLKSLSKISGDATRLGDVATQHKAFTRAVKILNIVESSGDIVIDKNFITVMMQCAAADQAKIILRSAQLKGMQPDNISYSVLCGLYAQIGDVSNVFRIIHEIVKSGLKPDTITWNTCLDACRNKGDLTLLHQTLAYMNAHRVPLSTAHLTIVIQAVTPFVANGNPHALRAAVICFEALRSKKVLNPRVTSRMASVHAARGPEGESDLNAFVKEFPTFIAYEEQRGIGMGSRWYREVRG